MKSRSSFVARLVACAVVICALAGCGPPPDTKMVKSVGAQDGRITVERVGVFGDDIAYHGERGIYIIRDNQTGAEYIGVSGVGISEVGRHSAGKSSVSDER